jgi:D-lyxose ketol-isomerase
MTDGRPALKRSVINRNIELAIQTFERFGVKLPPFAFWSVEQWRDKGRDCDEIRDCMLGWDVTDFGSGDFERIGRTLFTLRNGSARRPGYPKVYAEKLLFDPEGQRAPAHYHRRKMEDICCRAGGNILVQLRGTGADGQPCGVPLVIQVDGQAVRVAAGGIVRLRPGMSLTIPPGTIHQFWAEEGAGAAVSSEVSSVCDDWNDNVFLVDYAARFPAIEEDEPRGWFLCHEYPPARG